MEDTIDITDGATAAWVDTACVDGQKMMTAADDGSSIMNTTSPGPLDGAIGAQNIGAEVVIETTDTSNAASALASVTSPPEIVAPLPMPMMVEAVSNDEIIAAARKVAITREVLFAAGWLEHPSGRFMYPPYPAGDENQPAVSYFKRTDQTVNEQIERQLAVASPSVQPLGECSGNVNTTKKPTGAAPKQAAARKPTVASVVRNVSWPVGNNMASSSASPDPVSPCGWTIAKYRQRSKPPGRTAATKAPRSPARSPPRVLSNMPQRPLGRACFACGLIESHPIQHCPSWRRWTLQQRWTAVRQENRCQNCLKRQHPPPCWGGYCPHCPGRQEHNSWLCATMEKIMAEARLRAKSAEDNRMTYQQRDRHEYQRDQRDQRR